MSIGFHENSALHLAGNTKGKPNCFLQVLHVLPVLAICIIVFGGCSNDTDSSKGSVAESTKTTMSAQGPLPDKQSEPNIMIIELDCLRADHVGCYGYSKNTTPNIDALAKDGLVFEKFFTTSTWTRPSVASLFCSQYPGQTGISGIRDSLPSDKILLSMLMLWMQMEILSLLFIKDKPAGNVIASL